MILCLVISYTLQIHEYSVISFVKGLWWKFVHREQISHYEWFPLDKMSTSSQYHDITHFYRILKRITISNKQRKYQRNSFYHSFFLRFTPEQFLHNFYQQNTKTATTHHKGNFIITKSFSFIQYRNSYIQNLASRICRLPPDGLTINLLINAWRAEAITINQSFIHSFIHFPSHDSYQDGITHGRLSIDMRNWNGHVKGSIGSSGSTTMEGKRDIYIQLRRPTGDRENNTW